MTFDIMKMSGVPPEDQKDSININSIQHLRKSLENLPLTTTDCVDKLLSTKIEISVTNTSLELRVLAEKGGYQDALANVGEYANRESAGHGTIQPSPKRQEHNEEIEFIWGEISSGSPAEEIDWIIKDVWNPTISGCLAENCAPGSRSAQCAKEIEECNRKGEQSSLSRFLSTPGAWSALDTQVDCKYELFP